VGAWIYQSFALVSPRGLWARASALRCSRKRSDVSPAANCATESESILILKKDHVMELLAGGRVIRTYKVALGRAALRPRSGRATDARRRVTTQSMQSTRSATITRLSTSPIPTLAIVRGGKAWRLAGRGHHDHGLPNGKAGWRARTVSTTGRWAASPSPMKRSTKSGIWFLWARRLRFGRRREHLSI